MAGIADTGRGAAFTRAGDIFGRARRLIWWSRGRAWPFWLGFAVLGASMGLAVITVGHSSPQGIPAVREILFALGQCVGFPLIAPLAVRSMLGAERIWRLDRPYWRSVLMCAVPIVVGVLLNLAARAPLGLAAGVIFGLVGMCTVLGVLALALLPIGAVMDDHAFTVRVALRVMGRAFIGIYFAQMGMSLALIVFLLPLMLLLNMLGPSALPIWLALVTAGWMCSFSVLAAAYQLWREGRVAIEPHAAPAAV